MFIGCADLAQTPFSWDGESQVFPWHNHVFSFFKYLTKIWCRVRDLRFPLRSKLILPSSGLLRVARWYGTDVLVLPFGPIFKCQTFQESSWTVWPLKMRPIGGPETSVSNYLTPRDNPDNGWIHWCKVLYCRVPVLVERHLEKQVMHLEF